MKRMFYSLIIAALVSTLALGAEVRKLTQEDIEWGDPSTTVTSAAGHVGHPIDNTFKLSAPYIDVRAYGAKGDNATDDTAAIQAAYNVAKAIKGTVIVPPGIYKTTSTLTFDGNVNVMAASGGGAIIRPSSAVSIAITVDPPIGAYSPDSGYTHPMTISGLVLDGVNTSNATGIKIGSVNTEVGTVASVIIDRMMITLFQGANGIGLLVNNVVGATMVDTVLSKNATNMVLSEEYASMGVPNVTRFIRGSIRLSAVNEGVFIKNSNMVLFDSVIFENNKKEHIKIQPSDPVALAQLTTVINCWFEDAWWEYGAPTTKYAIVADGSVGANHLVSLNIQDSYFNISNASSKAIDLNYVYDTYISNVIFGTAVDNAVRIQNVLSHVSFGYLNTRFVWSTMIQNNDNVALRFAPGIGSINAPIYLTNNSTTPSVGSGDFFFAEYTSPTTVTFLNGGYIGKVVRIRMMDNNITWDFSGTNMYGNGGVDWNGQQNDWMECVFDGTRWFCSIHDTTL